jgi:N-acetylmuramoyl-L-alanine amidase
LNIVQRPIASGNYSVGRFGQPTSLIVLHTMDGYLSGTDSWFANPKAEVSAHYGVGLTGETHSYVSEGDTAWHAGNWLINCRSVGIETEDLRNPAGVLRTTEQNEATAQLVASICLRHGIPCDRAHVRRHNEVSGSHPLCPGNLDIDRIVARANEILHPAPAPSPDPHPGFPRVIRITFPSLRVRTQPNLDGQIVTQPTPDGLLHEGMTFTANGIVAGQEVDYGNGAHTNEWLLSDRGHYVWAGGTDYPYRRFGIERPQAEWDETFVEDPREIRLKTETMAVDVTGQSAPVRFLDVTRPVKVSGYFVTDGRKYWRGTTEYETGEVYGIPDEDVQATTSGQAVSIPIRFRKVDVKAVTKRYGLGALIRSISRRNLH